MPTGDGSGAAAPVEVVRELALAIRADDHRLDRFTGPAFEITASVLAPGRVYDSLDARFADLRAAYALVQVLPDPATIRELPDGRFAIDGEAHLTRADGGGVSTTISWIATVRDGRVARIEATPSDGTPLA